MVHKLKAHEDLKNHTVAWSEAEGHSVGFQITGGL